MTRVLAETLLARIVLARGKPVAGFDPQRYRREIVTNTDFCRHDETLCLVIDCPLAAVERIKACMAAYPSIENPMRPNQTHDAVKLSADIACPVHVCQPGIDHVAVPETYRALRDALLGRRAPTIVQYYPEAEHGFMHRKEPAANPAATAIASPQVVAFLVACLN